MASGLGALGDDHVAAVASSQRASATVVADDRMTAPVARRARRAAGHRQAEVEAHDRGPVFFDEPAGLVVEGVPSRSCRHPAAVDAELALEARAAPQTTSRAGPGTCGDVWQKKLTLRAGGRLPELVDLVLELLAVSIAAGKEPRPPAPATATASATPLEPAIGAWTMGSSVPRRAVSASLTATPRTLGGEVAGRFLPDATVSM